MKTIIIGFLIGFVLGVIITQDKAYSHTFETVPVEGVPSPLPDTFHEPSYEPSLPVDVQEYIDRFYKVAVSEMKIYNIPASIKLGQAILESGKGTSTLAIEANNHFGMKCRDFDGLPIGDLVRGCIEHPDSDSSGRWSKALFLDLETPWASYRAHSVILSGSRYKHLQNYGKDYRKWAWGLYESGYAVDPDYANKLIAVIEAYNLSQFDTV